MATMISEVFAAFKSAGVEDAKAQAAAEAMSAQGDRLTDVRDELRQEIRNARDEARQEAAKLRVDLADVRGSVRLLQWQMVAVFGPIVGLFWMMLRVAAKIGALPG